MLVSACSAGVCESSAVTSDVTKLLTLSAFEWFFQVFPYGVSLVVDADSFLDDVIRRGCVNYLDQRECFALGLRTSSYRLDPSGTY